MSSDITTLAAVTIEKLTATFEPGHVNGKELSVLSDVFDTIKGLVESLEAAEKRIAELEASHGNLREAVAGIHNTITGRGAHTPLAAILNASKRAYEESAAAAGKGD